MQRTLTPPETQPLYTAEDLLLFRDGPRYELLDGRLKEKSMGAKASRIAVELIAFLANYLRANRVGILLGSDAGYQMFPGRPNRVRFPDASVIRLGRLQNDETPDGYVALAPDLAVEVVSPNVEAYEVDDKIEEYLQAGVQLIWIIYSRSKTVMVFRHDGTVGRFKQADDLLGESVLPGFSCRVGDLF
jgi:Uma2 family endonuclease